MAQQRHTYNATARRHAGTQERHFLRRNVAKSIITWGFVAGCFHHLGRVSDGPFHAVLVVRIIAIIHPNHVGVRGPNTCSKRYTCSVFGLSRDTCALCLFIIPCTRPACIHSGEANQRPLSLPPITPAPPIRHISHAISLLVKL